AQRTVSAAVHRLRSKTAGEHSAHEDEILILARPAHTVVAGGPTNHENVPAALIRADQIPPLLPQAFVLIRLRRARLLAATRIHSSLTPRSSGDAQAWCIPGRGRRLIQPVGDL